MVFVMSEDIHFKELKERVGEAETYDELMEYIETIAREELNMERNNFFPDECTHEYY